MSSRIDAVFDEKMDARGQLTIQLCLALTVLLTLVKSSPQINAALSVYCLGRSGVGCVALQRATVPALLVASVAFVLGFKGRLAGLLVCLILGLLWAIGVEYYHNNVYLLFLVTLVACLDYRADYSVRSFVTPIKGDPVGRSFVPALLRGQLVIVYLYAVLAKLTDPTWMGRLHGATLRWVMAIRTNEGWFSRSFARLMAWHRFSDMTSVVVILVELVLPFMLLSRRFRSRGLAVGVAVHVAMQESLAPGAFTFLMLTMYIAFVPSGDRAYRVSFRPACTWVERFRRAFNRLDWLARTQWETSSSHDVEVRGPRGERWVGWVAAVRLSFLSPVLLVAYTVLGLAPLRSGSAPSETLASVRNGIVAIAGILWLVTEFVMRRDAPATRASSF